MCHGNLYLRDNDKRQHAAEDRPSKQVFSSAPVLKLTMEQPIQRCTTCWTFSQRFTTKNTYFNLLIWPISTTPLESYGSCASIDPINFPKFLHVLTLELKWFQCKQMRQALDILSNFSDKLIKMTPGPAFVIFSVRQTSPTDITVRVVGCSVCFLCFFWSFSWSVKDCNFSHISPTESSWHGWSREWLGKQKRPLRKGFSNSWMSMIFLMKSDPCDPRWLYWGTSRRRRCPTMARTPPLKSLPAHSSFPWAPSPSPPTRVESINKIPERTDNLTFSTFLCQYEISSMYFPGEPSGHGYFLWGSGCVFVFVPFRCWYIFFLFGRDMFVFCIFTWNSLCFLILGLG